MSVGCTAAPCPVVLDSTCVFYSGGNLIYTGINTNDNLQTALIKINNKFKDAGLGYVFQNGIVQSAPGQPVKLGGSLVENTLITSGGFIFGLTGTIEASAFITTGGTSSEFVKGDGSLDSTSYQVAGNYITSLTGDGTASGPGSAALTLATVNLGPGTFGSSSLVPVVTVNAKGLVTNVTTTPINYPTQSIAFSGDVYGAGYTGSSTVLTISNVNPNIYITNSALKFAVNGKGLITSAAPITNLDLDAIYGYTPIGDAPFDGTIYGRRNHAWVNIPSGSGTVTSVGVTSGTGISASVTNPTTTPNITITNTAPDQTVVLNSGTGINVTGTYPNFTITNTGIAPTGSALTKVNDTNVTLTLGGTPATALLQAVSLTLGWTGTLADSRITSASTWNAKQDAITLTTTGSSGPATFIGNTLNIPQYTGGSGTVTSVQLSAGTGISLSGTNPITTSGTITVTNSAPDQTVVLSSGTGISTSGTYPNFTITNTSPDQTVALSSGTGISVTGTYPNFTITNTSPSSGGTVTSVGLSMPSAFTVTNSPVTTTGTLTVAGAGTASQYIRGDGVLATFPTGGGGGASVNYYLNGSVNQGTFGGNTYYQMSRTAVTTTPGTDFTIAANGIIARFITDANDPGLLNIPGGNWNIEFFFSASSPGGTPTFYVNVYKYNGGFTLIGTSSTAPEGITNGTLTDSYYTSVSIPVTTLTVTDRIAIEVYVNNSGRTITLHTEDNHLCEVITTFTTGLTALNGLTAQVQYFATGTAGTDFAISSSTATHTFNLPTASATNRGALSSSDWTTFNNKVTSLSAGTGISIGGTTTVPTVTNTAPDQTVVLTAGTGIGITGTYPSFTITNSSPSSGGTVTSVAALTLGTTGTDLSSTVANGTTTPVITLNVPTASATNRGALSSTDWSTFNGKIGGSGTTNQIAYFTASGTIGSLTTATYPSLTELSYVKGVTSAIQTQLDTKSVKLITTNRQVASYILALTDADLLVEMNVGTANNLTVPPSGTVNFSIGTQIQIAQYGAGQTTVVAGLGVTIRSAGTRLKLNQQYSGATLIKIAADEWYLFGDLSA